MVILIFIFLTPKSWFASGERPQNKVHQSPVTLVVKPEVVGNEGDKARIEQHVKTVTGRSDVEVVDIRKRFRQDGRIESFEVDIR